MSRQGPSRRSVLGLLTAAPLTAAAVLADSASAAADADSSPVPRSLLPGGEYDKFIAAQATADQFSGNVMLARRGRPVLGRDLAAGSCVARRCGDRAVVCPPLGGVGLDVRTKAHACAATRPRKE